jgi:hypothetical protein
MGLPHSRQNLLAAFCCAIAFAALPPLLLLDVALGCWLLAPGGSALDAAAAAASVLRLRGRWQRSSEA